MKSYVTIIMPTLNSASTIGLSLASIKKQDYKSNLIEILVIDGGSTDNTLTIAKKYKCKIINNKEVQQEYAKHKGLIYAKSPYVMFLDSDEILENKDSISKRVEAFENDLNIQILFSGGYKSQVNSPYINDYVNTFGDPFAYFMYNISPDSKFFLKDYKNKYHHYDDCRNYVNFHFTNKTTLPLIDLCAGTMIRMSFLTSCIPKFKKDPTIIPQIPYILMKKSKSIAILKNNPIIHNSVDSIKKYLNKLQWRIIVNIHFVNHPGTGFSNRESYQPSFFTLKKYLFIPFSLSFIGPLIITFKFLLRKKSPSVLLHPLLSMYVAINIAYFYILKIFGIKPKLFLYGKLKK